MKQHLLPIVPRLLFLLLIPSLAAAQIQVTHAEVLEVLNDVYDEDDIPALSGAVVSPDGLVAQGAVGVRKTGEDVAVTDDDMWHLGSDTKAMTAVLVATFVEEGRLRWDQPMGEILPELKETMTPEFTKLTMLHLLSHRSGLPPNIAWNGIPRDIPMLEQRRRVLSMACGMELQSTPGTEYQYSNLGYAVAGSVLEALADSTWEDLITARVFQPLGMTEVGFGGLGTKGKIDQPWPHGGDGDPMEENGPEMDNPPVLGPAGTVHASLDAWASFIADQLRGRSGKAALLRNETYETLHTPPFGGSYALGWAVVEREWGDGIVLSHAGSNTMNFCVAWVSPNRGFAVLAVSNQGGDEAAKACDLVSWGLIQKIID